ncbi:hypothetical protein PV08_12059 [Exophiala spinifera]|uniref:Ubiquitin-like protease family profile domain-containing protein n=1 Tax=Exophiala spinifera TaxID=91928 RepID=A0A0D1Y432_9EURO|nr:uncharacterized protein PV08_12059 [Exophiala spinifera]KIW09716.1 hypothetical protein PV08_12059 [Exophiala spinifera]
MGRRDVHVVESHDFNAAYIQKNPSRICRWQTPSMVLVPVHIEETSHWFLISLQFTHRQLTVHDHENERAISVAHFILSSAPELNGWTVSYSLGSINDGNNCGVILLHEADKILGHTDPSPLNFVALRRNFLQLIVAVHHTDVSQMSLGTSTPSSARTTSPDPSPCTRLKPKFDDLPPQIRLKFLASSMGCKEVLEDFRDLVDILKGRSLRDRGDTQGIMQLYNSSRNLRQDVLSNRTPSNSSIESALKLYNTLRSPGQSSENVCTSFLGCDKGSLQAAVQLYTRRRGYEKLSSLKKDFGAMCIASTYRALIKIFQRESMEGTSEGIRMRVDDGQADCIKRGLKSDTRAYWFILRYTQQDKDPTALGQLKKANYWGTYLHEFENICGPSHPLWMLRPVRRISCALDPDYRVRPSCYENLNKSNIQMVVDLFKNSNRRLWDFLPRCEQGIERILAGEGVDDGFMEEFERLFSG